MGPVLTMTLAQLAIFTERCAAFQDPAFGDTSEQATQRALEHVFGAGCKFDFSATVQIRVA